MKEEMKKSELDFYEKEMSELDRLVGLMVESKEVMTVGEIIELIPHLVWHDYSMTVEGETVYAVFTTRQMNYVTLVGIKHKQLAPFRTRQRFVVIGLVHGDYAGR